jgi:hypothetical protein
MENLVDAVRSYSLQYNMVSLCVKEPWEVRWE